MVLNLCSASRRSALGPGVKSRFVLEARGDSTVNVGAECALSLDAG